MRTILIIALAITTVSAGEARAADDPYQRLEQRSKAEGWSPERTERARQRVDIYLEREVRVKKLSFDDATDPYKRLDKRAKIEGWTPEELELARQAVDRHLDREIRLKKLSY